MENKKSKKSVRPRRGAATGAASSSSPPVGNHLVVVVVRLLLLLLLWLLLGLGPCCHRQHHRPAAPSGSVATTTTAAAFEIPPTRFQHPRPRDRHEDDTFSDSVKQGSSNRRRRSDRRTAALLLLPQNAARRDDEGGDDGARRRISRRRRVNGSLVVAAAVAAAAAAAAAAAGGSAAAAAGEDDRCRSSEARSAVFAASNDVDNNNNNHGSWSRSDLASDIRRQQPLRTGVCASCGPPLPLPPPVLLAIVTDPTSCDTDQHLAAALHSLEMALSTGWVDLVIVRLDVPPDRSSTPRRDDDASDLDDDDADHGTYRRRVRRLLRTLGQWSRRQDGSAELEVEEEMKVDEEDNISKDGWTSNILAARSTRRKRFVVVVSSALFLAEPPMLLDVDDDEELMDLADGVHVKESHRPQLPAILERINKGVGGRGASDAVVGMSCHSVESALDAHKTYRPDYLLVGTCYPTLSHPEKMQKDVEGPDLPGQVRRELEQRRVVLESVASARTELRLRKSEGDVQGEGNQQASTDDGREILWRRPAVLGIGGIDSTNCGRVVEGGADGVAVIRSVLAAPNPAQAVQQIVDAMVRAQARFDDDAPT